MNCDRCELCQTAQSVGMLGVGNEHARIMCVQDCPTKSDDIKGEPFISPSFKAFKKAMSRRSIDPDDVYYTSLVKCYPPNEEPPKGKHVKACTDLLNAEVKVVDPDIIVPMGNNALKWAVGRVGLTKMRGNAQEVDILGRTRIVLPMMNPNQVSIRPAYRQYILKDLDTLSELYEHGMTPITDIDYRSLETVDEVVAEIVRLKSEAEIISFDLETSGKSAFYDDSKIVCISLTDKTHYGVVIPLYHRESPFTGSDRGFVVKLLRWLLEDESIPKVAQNGKFDIEWLYYWLDIDVKNFAFDTMLAHYLAISEEQGTQGLKTQAWEYTDMGGYDNDLDEVRNKLPEAIRYNYDNIPWSILKTYAVADVDCCLRLYYIYKPLIDDNPQWTAIMNEIMMPASYALRDVEGNGMKLDFQLAEKYKHTYQAEIDRIVGRLESYPEVLELEREKQALFDERELIKSIPKKDRTEEEQAKFIAYKKYENYKFNWGSAVQLRELLFDKLGLVTSVMTSTGEYSTSEESMKELQDQHEIPSLLLELRKVTTLNNMFIQKLPTMADSQGIVHPSFNLTGTVTGRMSSENPNAQQMPRKAENPTLFQYHNEPKSLFVSRFGKQGCIMNADYSALEMRVAGIVSGDKNLISAFLSGEDLHKSTASLVFNVPIDKVDKDLRTRAKAVNFGIIYGKSGVTFARDLYYDKSGENPNKTAEWESAKAQGIKLVDDYLATFSGLAKWLKHTRARAAKCGYVETVFGRRRRLPDLRSQVDTLRANAERQAINAPIQGTGSDFTLLSLIQINEWLRTSGKRSKLICTVHDSIVFDVYVPELPQVATQVKSIMEHVHEPYISTEIPIIADLELGVNYGATFGVELEECQAIETVEQFNEWVNQKTMSKYKHEIDVLKDKGWGYKKVIRWMQEHDRPIEQLSGYIVEVYK